MPDELETILRLVSEGHLGADEAERIIEALQAARERRNEAAGRGAPGTSRRPDDDRSGPRQAAGRGLRVEVTEAGRQVVNLRIPLGLASFAVDRVPGLSGQYRDSIREAVRAGLSGPIVDVGEGGDRVLVVLE